MDGAHKSQHVDDVHTKKVVKYNVDEKTSMKPYVFDSQRQSSDELLSNSLIMEINDIDEEITG